MLFYKIIHCVINVENFSRLVFHRFFVEKSVKKVENRWNYILY